MHNIDEKTKAAIDIHPEADWGDPDNLDWLVDQVSMSGNLEALIALACEEALAFDPPPEDDPSRVRHPGARVAIEAYAAWKRAEGRDVPIVMNRPEPESDRQPEILPLALLGKWVAWSSDGMKILASSETSEEAERLANEAGEPEPILHRPMAGH